MKALFQDIRFALRMMLKNPAFSLVAIITLALGIGANTAIFSIVNSVLLRPLPYPESKRLVWLTESGPNFPSMSIAYPNFVDWQEQQTVFESIGIYKTNNFTLTNNGEPQRLKGANVSSGVFNALGIQPILGRVFTAEEDKQGVTPVVVLSYNLWQSRFGGQSNVINQTITLEGNPRKVVGVMPPGFSFPTHEDIWVSMGVIANNKDLGFSDRGFHAGFFAVARLKPNVSLEQARTAMDAVAVNLERQYPDKNKNQRVVVNQLIDTYVSNVRLALWILLAAVGLVLIIACVNVANLLLARSATRQKEIALRAALGAGRLRIIRQLLTESVLLAGLGGALGLILAWFGLPLILAVAGNSIPRAETIQLDGNVLIFTTATAFVTGILFGLVPAWQTHNSDLQTVLKDTARGVTGGRARLRHALVVAEVALTILLLVCAGLLLRSFYRLQQVNPGFVTERVLSLKFDLSGQKYDKEEKSVTFYKNFLEKVRSLPGVQTAGITSRVPLDSAERADTDFLIEGQPALPPGEKQTMELSWVSPDYFQAVGIPLIRGRSFTELDDRNHLQGRNDLDKPAERWIAGLTKIIIDEEFARKYWANQNPIGQRVRLPWRKDGPILEVVGVVGRVKLDKLSSRDGFVHAYVPFMQAPRNGMAVVIKTTLPPETLITAVRQQVHTLDSDLPIYDIRTLSEIRDNSIASQRLNLTLLGIFAALSVVLAMVGLYGVLAYSVTQHHQEIGVRMALGARPRDIFKLVVGQGMLLVLIGAVIGLASALAITRLMASLLYDISVTDPITFLGFPLLLIMVAFVACYFPARKATKVDPINALRCE